MENDKLLVLHNHEQKVLKKEGLNNPHFIF